ncbi:MAG: DNA-directed RNA polymerase subunit omega [Halanaerobiales bacterium]|nr:DNA-directed RNA polymerase subunit omega [Halanaerobiales bacterium]
MVKPSLDELLTKVDNTYTLVIATSRRARMLKDGAELLISVEGSKPVSHALEEIFEDEIKIIPRNPNKNK